MIDSFASALSRNGLNDDILDDDGDAFVVDDVKSGDSFESVAKITDAAEDFESELETKSQPEVQPVTEVINEMVDDVVKKVAQDDSGDDGSQDG